MIDLLFLAHRVPFPPDRGDRIRSYHMLRYLAGRARVHLVAFADEATDLPATFRDGLASCTIVPRTKTQARAAVEGLATGQPVSLTAFASEAMRQAVAGVLARERVDAIYAFSGQMAQYLPSVAPRTIMDFVDVDSAKFAAFAQGANPAVAWMMRREARLLAAFERSVANRVDASVFVSEAEATLFRSFGGGGRVVAVENGIDTGFFNPDAVFARRLPDGPLIVFTGQMDYRPNVEAVTWFADAILPLVRERHPGARFAVVGRAPTASVTALAARPGIVVTGAVPDVRGWLAAADVCVAPLKLARGIQNKVLEAMAMARPVVASAAAAEGIDHAGTIRVAREAHNLAREVVALIDSPREAAAVGARARAQAIARYGWAARLAPLDALVGLSA